MEEIRLAQKSWMECKYGVATPPVAIEMDEAKIMQIHKMKYHIKIQSESKDYFIDVGSIYKIEQEGQNYLVYCTFAPKEHINCTAKDVANIQAVQDRLRDKERTQ